jgi:hypothetical protein
MKATLANAESGQDVMIKVAFDCHTGATRRFETERETFDAKKLE